MSNARPHTDARARTRIVTELSRNLLVEAGAGSGKTHALAARMAAGVASGEYAIEQMAAVTFTRKAAAELRGRFQLALEELLPEAGRGPESGDAGDRTRRLQRALSDLERFFAGTIHAFCARLLHERPVEAGVSPGFTELDDVEEQLLRQQSWRDFRAQAKAAGDPDLVYVLDAGISAKQLDGAFETVCLYEDVTFPPGDAEVPDGTKTWKALETFWSEISTRLPVPPHPESKCKTQERARNFDRRWKFFLHQERTPVRLVELLRIWEGKPSITLKWWSTRQVAREVEELLATFRETVVLPHLTAWRHYLYRRSVTLLVKARDAGRHERLRRNSLSFNDLLLMTAGVLRSNAGVRRALQRKYRWLFVDEFQDTDPIQAEIMFLLAADEPEGAPAGSPDVPADWRSVRLRPGALFVVGDPKQSIYRFRRADIDIYNEVRERLGGTDGAGIVSLTTNFRSVPGLCDWANRVFQGRFPAEPTAHAPKFAPLDADRDPLRDPALAVLDIPSEVDGADVAREEADRIARYIRAEADAGRRKFGDFLILTRKKRALQPYAAALEALQVPIEVTGAGAFGDSDEVRQLALLLTALADPQDVVSLVGVLRGPFFGLSDRDLFAYRQGGAWFSVFAEAPRDRRVLRDPRGPRVDAVASALAQLHRWHRWTRLLPAGAALERILEESGYLALAATTPDGVEAGDLFHAIDRVRGIVERGFTLAQAAEALATWTGLDGEEPEDSNDVDSLPLEPGRRDVVRLMNLHKAKGLEADVVFLADPLGGYDPHVDVRILRDGSVRPAARRPEPAEVRPTALGYFQITEPGNWAKRVLAEPFGWETFETDELEYLRAEVDRLLYVAATRARDLLVIGRWPGARGKRKAAWDAFLPFLSSAHRLVVPASVSLPSSPSVESAATGVASAIAAASAAHDRARQPSWSATSVTAEAKRLPRVTLGSSDDVQDDDPTRGVVADTPSRRADAGMAWGTLIHGLLEHAMRYRAATRDDLRRLAMWLTVEEPLLRTLVDQALDTVEAVKAGDFWQAARASSEAHEEAPFSRLQPDPAVPNVLSGTIDLVYRDGREWRIVDYKTDADFASADLAARHRAQMQAYEQAWGQVARAPVKARIVGAR